MLPVKSNLLPTVSKFFDDDWNNVFDFPNRNLKHNNYTLPLVNIADNSNEFIIQLAAPGLKREDFQIELNNDVLFVKGEVNTEEKVNNNINYTRREFDFGSFERSFHLNNSVVDDQKIEANYKNGVLFIHIGKKEHNAIKIDIS